MTEPDYQRQRKTQDRVFDAILAAAPKQLTALDIADAIGGVLPATTSKHAFALYKAGRIDSELRPKPGYPHIVRRHYWAKE